MKKHQFQHEKLFEKQPLPLYKHTLNEVNYQAGKKN